MDSLHLREILLKIGKDMKCPMCSAPIHLHNIELFADDRYKDGCAMEVECEHCHFIFGGHAKVMQITTPEGKKFNASTLAHPPKHVGVISELEKKSLHEHLIKGSFMIS